MVTNPNSRVNRDRVYRSKESRRRNCKVKSIAQLVSGRSWKNRRKVELREKGSKGRSIITVRHVHLDIEITSKDHRALLIGKESKQVSKLFHEKLKRNIGRYTINTSKYKI